MTSFEQYIEIIEFWKLHQPVITDAKHRHPGWQAHHPIPRAFKKIKDEYKHEFTRKLEALYQLDETILVPDRIHFEIHMLLVEIYPERSQEWFKMLNATDWFRGKRKGNFNITPQEYEKLKSFQTKMSPETKEKLRLKNLGRKHSEETRKKQSESHQKANKNPIIIESRRLAGLARRGKKKSDETISRMCVAQQINQKRPEMIEMHSKANKGRKHTKKARENMSKGHLGITPSDETRKKQSESQKRVQADGEIRAKKSKALKAFNTQPGVKEQKSAIMIGKNLGKKMTDEQRLHNSEVQKIAMNRSDVKERIRLSRLGKKASDETRKKRSDSMRKILALKRLVKRFMSSIKMTNYIIIRL